MSAEPVRLVLLEAQEGFPLAFAAACVEKHLAVLMQQVEYDCIMGVQYRLVARGNV